MTTNVVPIPISNIITHTSFHLDEVAAVYLLRLHGESLFPGIRMASLRFSEGVEARPDASFDACKVLPVGCVPGTRFNDKDKDGKRIPGICTTTKVYQHLGTNGDSALERIVSEVLRCDSEAGVRNTELAELVKMALRSMPNENVWKWATDILTAVHSRLSYGFVKVSGEDTLQGIFDSLAKAGHFPDERCKRRLGLLVSESMKRRECITELAFITESLFRARNPDARDYVRFALEYLYKDQILFWGAVEECRSSPNRCLVNMRNGGDGSVTKLSVLLVNSDNPNALRASRHQKGGAAGLTIIRNSKGQVGVFTDKDRGVSLDDLVAMIRWAELPKSPRDGHPLIDDETGVPLDITPDKLWSWLQSEGVLGAVPHWYYFKKAQQFLNGSLSRPGVEPTQIASQYLLDVARDAFDGRAVAEWKRRRHIWVPE